MQYVVRDTTGSVGHCKHKHRQRHSSRKNKLVDSKYKPRTAAGAYQGLMHKQTAHMSIQHTQVDSTHKSIAQVDRTQVDSTHK